MAEFSFSGFATDSNYIVSISDRKSAPVDTKWISPKFKSTSYTLR